MIREFEIAESSIESIKFNIDGLIEDNLRFYTTYDTSTGEVLPDYIAWKTLSSSTGKVSIKDSYLFPKQIQSTVTFDYSNFQERNFIHITSYEFNVLTQLLQKIDSVRTKYPNSFPKKFSLEELLTCVEAGLADINLYPPYTGYWFRFSQIREEDINANPFLNDINSGVPYIWLNLVTTGAFLNALIMQGLLEVDINFNASDQGINITYQNAEGIKGWYTSLLDEYERNKKRAKIFTIKPQATGTFPFAAGYWANISSALGNLARAGFPFWQSYLAGRPG